MSGGAAVQRGAVLRAWRAAAGLSQTEFGQRFDPPVSDATISSWEVAERGKYPNEQHDLYQVALNTGFTAATAETIVLMCAAAGTVAALEPSARWAHNYNRPGAPCWAWLRVPVGELGQAAAVWWGAALQGTAEIITSNGLFLTFPSNLPNPPLEVTFNGAGWVDFGLGEPPVRVLAELDVEILDARSLLEPVAPVDPDLDASERESFRPAAAHLRNLAESLHVGWSVLVPHLGMAHSRRAPVALDGQTVGANIDPGMRHTSSGGDIEVQAMMSPAQLAALREARGLTLKAVADAVTALDPRSPVSRNVIKRVESEGRFGAADNLLSRLDTVYRADGRLAVERTFDSRAARSEGKGHKSYTIAFPSTWIGPVWVQAFGPNPGDQQVVDLAWGLWRRRQWVRSGTVMTTRRAQRDQQPLVVTVPNSWRLIAGVGASPSALDVNRDWWPRNFSAALQLLGETIRTIRSGTASPIDT